MQAEIRHPDGTTVTKRFRNELQANDWLEVQRSHSLAVADTTMRLEEWMEEWFRYHHHVAPSTHSHNRSHFECHFDAIRRLTLTQLTVPVCRRWLDDLDEEFKRRKPPGGQPYTVAHCYILLRTALGGAYEHGLIAWNPLATMRSPGRPAAAPRFMSLEDAQSVLRVIKSVGDHRGLGAQMMLRLGLRRGEALGLRWDDVNFEQGIVSVRNQLTRVPALSGRGTVLDLVGPKSVWAERSLKVDERLLDDLALRSPPHGSRERATGFVVSPGKGAPVDPEAITRWLKQMAATVDIYCTPHRLRHTAATIMLNEGIRLETVAAVLGHSDIRTAQKYARVLESTKGQALQVLADALDARSAR